MNTEEGYIESSRTLGAAYREVLMNHSYVLVSHKRFLCVKMMGLPDVLQLKAFCLSG